MKILQVLADYQLGGGYLPAIVPLSKELRTIGHDVDIVGVSVDLSKNHESINTFVANKYSFWFYSITLRDWLHDNINKYDVIHIHGLWTYPQYIATRLARKNKIPYVISPHGIFVDPRRYKSLKKKIYSNLISNDIINYSSAIHVSSEFELFSTLEAGINKPLKMIPWGLEFQNIPLSQEKISYDIRNIFAISQECKIILYISRISPEKGLDQLMVSLCLLKEKFPNFILIIAGEDDKKYNYKSKLIKLIKDLNLDNFIFFPGLVQGDVKKSLLQQADFFIMPSYGENFSFAVAEALASGLPVITTTRTPWSILNETFSGRCVNPDPNSLYLALYELLSMNSIDHWKMKCNAEKLIFDKHDWTKLVKEFELFYRSVI